MTPDPLDTEKTLIHDDKPAGYALVVGSKLGQYHIIRPLGRGGMGEVYEVEHLVLRRRYAIKLLSGELMARPDAVERFKREAQVMAGLHHPNILGVDEFGETDGQFWLRMGLAGAGEDVRSLEDMARENNGRLDAETWRIVMTQVLDGLAYAHEHGVVHRDLKPSNILLTPVDDGTFLPAIADFGLARLVGEEWLRSRVESSVRLSMSLGQMPTAHAQKGSSTRSLLGTYEYMSPEQKRGEEATEKSDIYAIGLMAYRLLTGRAPTLKKPSELIPGLDPAWDAWITCCLEEDPADRPTSRELRQRIASLTQKRPVLALKRSGFTPPVLPTSSDDAAFKARRQMEDAPKKIPGRPKSKLGCLLLLGIGVCLCISILSAILVPSFNKALVSAAMVQTATNGRNIYQSIFANQMDDVILGNTPKGWPKKGQYSTSTEYFKSLVNSGILNVPYDFFAARGIPPAKSTDASDFTADNNAWRIVLGLDDAPDDTPFMFTRNYDPGVLRSGDEPIVLNDEPPFGKEGMVVVLKGGSAFSLKGNQLRNSYFNPAQTTSGADIAIVGP